MGIYVALFNGVRYVMLQTMKLAWNREFVWFSLPDSRINEDNGWWKRTYFGFWRLLSFQFISVVSVDLYVTCLICCVQIRLLPGGRVHFFLMQMNIEACQNRHKIWITYQRSGAGVCLYLNSYVHSWHVVTIIWVRWCVRGKPWVYG